MAKRSKVDFERTKTDLFLKYDGVVIAKRGQSNSDRAGMWIALEPGYEVIDGRDGKSVHIRRQGVRIN